MHELFRMEAESQTNILTTELLNLEKHPESDDKLEKLMRASHSMKGAARIVGIDTVVKIAHTMEDCFVAAQHGKLSLLSSHIDLLLQAVDTISHIAHLSDGETSVWISENQSKLSQLQGDLAAILSGTFESGQKKSNHKFKRNKVEQDVTRSKQQTSADQPEVPNKAREQVTTAVAHSSQELSDERVIRLNADRLTRIMGLSSELMVESRWLKPFSNSILQLKRKHSEITQLLESLRDSLETKEGSGFSKKQLMEAQLKLTDCRSILSEKLLELDDFDRRNTNLSTNMYNEVVASRMRPFADAVQGLQRMVRDIARTLDKDVQLNISGLDTPVDRDVIEKIKAPLTHLVRNAIDHGIEPPQQRQKLGKPAQGILSISASHGGGMLNVIVQDDGSGINLEILRKIIVDRRLAPDMIAKNLTEAELLDFLFLPDFSTKNKVTEISGRGVGLDVVRTMIQELRGTVWTTNSAGSGMCFTIQVPLTLSVISVILVEVSSEIYAFPLSRVDRLLKISPEEPTTIEGRQYITVDNEHVGLISASQILEFVDESKEYEDFSVVVISDRLSRYGVVVDKLLGQRTLSVQALDPRLGKVQDISAAALTDDGSPALIFDVDDLVRSIDKIANGGPIGNINQYRGVLNKKIRKRVLVVDDSLTVREVERQLLESQGYRVDVSVDGMDGWNAVRRTKYDLVVTDVDMPRMDGIELLTYMKQDHHLKNIPVMIVSYKDRQEDRQRGLQAGADYYLTKGSFHDETLIEAVVDLIGEASA